MANKIISNLDQLSDPQGSDILPITDVSDTTGSSAAQLNGLAWQMLSTWRT